jgi:hypothetical protein
VRSSYFKALLCAVAVSGCSEVSEPSGSVASVAPETSVAGADLTGVWNNDAPPATRAYQGWGFSEDPPEMTPWAQERFDQARPTFGPNGVMATQSNDPVYQCFPAGLPRIYFHPFPLEIIQTPGRVLMVFEYDHTVRPIYTDGRGHRDDLAPSWMGDSIGHWEGDTLVVETANFNDQTWVDRRGTPHSTELRVLERIHKTDADHLQIDLTIEDPVAFPHAWMGQRFFKRVDWDIEEFFCGERNMSDTFQEYEQGILQYVEPSGEAAPQP